MPLRHGLQSPKILLSPSCELLRHGLRDRQPKVTLPPNGLDLAAQSRPHALRVWVRFHVGPNCKPDEVPLRARSPHPYLPIRSSSYFFFPSTLPVRPSLGGIALSRDVIQYS
eukprot:872569-Pyramimonas_sp.AAC.1